MKKTKQRIKKTAEVFTPDWLVNQMLDKLTEYSPDTFTNPKKTYLDPACGNGNILIEVLKRKLQHTNPTQALETIYGCDIMQDNILECKSRLLQCVSLCGQDYKQEQIENILDENIVHTPLDKYPNGSLDYLTCSQKALF